MVVEMEGGDPVPVPRVVMVRVVVEFEELDDVSLE